MAEIQPHIQLGADLGIEKAVIMGDPARLDKIATLLENVKELAYNREFRSLRGTYREVAVLALSTGVGAPSAAIAMEEMHNIGIKQVVRVGSAGAMQAGIELGKLIIAEGVVRNDGLTLNYAPAGYPAVPDSILLGKARKFAPKAEFGIVRSHDGFYMDNNADVEAFWSNLGVVGADMESGAMMVVGRLRGMQTLSILNNVVLYGADLAEGVNDLVNADEVVSIGEIASLQLAFDVLTDK
jgi:uridine phosphorylase